MPSKPVLPSGNKSEMKSYDVQTGKPDVILGTVDMKMAMATIFVLPWHFQVRKTYTDKNRKIF